VHVLHAHLDVGLPGHHAHRARVFEPPAELLLVRLNRRPVAQDGPVDEVAVRPERQVRGLGVRVRGVLGEAPPLRQALLDDGLVRPGALRETRAGDVVEGGQVWGRPHVDGHVARLVEGERVLGQRKVPVVGLEVRPGGLPRGVQGRRIRPAVAELPVQGHHKVVGLRAGRDHDVVVALNVRRPVEKSAGVLLNALVHNTYSMRRKTVGRLRGRGAERTDTRRFTVGPVSCSEPVSPGVRRPRRTVAPVIHTYSTTCSRTQNEKG